MANILLLDNIDSFTYNLVEQLRNQQHYVVIYRNTVDIAIIIDTLNRLIDPIVVFSPGPGLPQSAGCMLKLIETIKGKIPMVGICLGHQAIVEAYGGAIGYAHEIYHGKSSLIHHDALEMFQGLSQPLPVARYHSLICNKIPKNFTVNSHYNKTIMSVRNNTDRVCGFQFHPESILTTQGDKILQQIIQWASFKHQ